MRDLRAARYLKGIVIIQSRARWPRRSTVKIYVRLGSCRRQGSTHLVI